MIALALATLLPACKDLIGLDDYTLCGPAGAGGCGGGEAPGESGDAGATE